jgi:hypothetical protein
MLKQPGHWLKDRNCCGIRPENVNSRSRKILPGKVVDPANIPCPAANKSAGS